MPVVQSPVGGGGLKVNAFEVGKGAKKIYGNPSSLISFLVPM